MASDSAKHYDCIVIGVGSMGSAACYYLSKQNLRVLGLEQFTSPHKKGAHGGFTRIIRKAYFEHPNYVPLLKRAYENWHDLELQSGEQLYVPTGLLYAGPPGNDLLKRIREAAQQYAIPLEEWDAEILQKRFPQFTLPDNAEIMYEPEAGLLYPDKAIETFIRLSTEAGADIRQESAVISWKANATGVTVQTALDTFTADKLIVTAGPWAGAMVPGAQQHLTITQQTLAWYAPPSNMPSTVKDFPCWLIAVDGVPGAYYGFPANQEQGPLGWKVAHHYPGNPIHPDAANRIISKQELQTLENVAMQYLGVAPGSLTSTQTCLYSNTPDEHFVIDLLPNTFERVSVAWGFSGHGFKFTPVVGEILADLCIHGKTALPAQFLESARLSQKEL
ncbi:MAG: N-methyl-L-tryptophan oxidase [Sediminibacterium sp.]|nr:N-methyl-L-tryptophan oxidase [Sediminibacterium sp.]